MRWLSLDAALRVGAAVMGDLHFRDLELLDSALGRVRTAYAYAEGAAREPWAVAAGYAAAVVRNHPLIDGNKRLGWALAAAFLDANGYGPAAGDPVLAAEMMVGLAARRVSTDDLAFFLRGRCGPGAMPTA